MRVSRRWMLAATAGVALSVALPTTATAAAAPPPPDLVSLLSGFDDFWTSDGQNDLHGTVVDGDVLATNDARVTWINGHATAEQQFAALQDAQYGISPNGYDQSITISTALGSVLGPIYVAGRQAPAETSPLPLTNALIASTGGSAGAFVSTDAAKETYSFPRPFVPSDPQTPDNPFGAGCEPDTVNASSLQSNRIGKPYADSLGNLDITLLQDTTDSTDQFAADTVSLEPGYASLCTSGSFPSGHTTTAHQAGVTLATMLPELAPEILTRASENGNNRLVIGVHSPLDIIGGRISGHAALATLWSDETFRTETLEPAITELRAYLEKECGNTIAICATQGQPYTNDPYGGQAMPGGTAQIVTDRASGIAVYEERMTYAFPTSGTTGLAPDVPAGAENLLLTTFPTLTDAQRISVLAQTQIASGYPLDQTGSNAGSWQRIDLAAATSATVQLDADGGVQVVSVGGTAQVLPVATVPPASPTPSAPPATATPVPTLAESGTELQTVAPLFLAGGTLLVGMTVVLAVSRRRRNLEER